jgi:hypothetical protein
MSFTGTLQLSPQEVNATNVNKLARLGSVGQTADGRKYRYAQNGAVALSAGKTVNAIAKVANHTTQTVQAAAAAGSYSVSVTVGATAMTTEQYTDGYLVVKDVAGFGSAYRIASHTTVSASGGVVTVSLQEPLVTALTTSSIVSFVASPWSAVVVAPAAAAEVVVGVPQLAVPASAYFWTQVGGMASVLSDGVITKGGKAIQSVSVIGAAKAAAAADITQDLGWAPEATVDTKYEPLYLQCD